MHDYLQSCRIQVPFEQKLTKYFKNTHKYYFAIALL